MSARLEETWKEALAGARILVPVSGYSGAGKTTLIRQMQPRVEADGGIFIAGKFDQIRRGTPISPSQRR